MLLIESPEQINLRISELTQTDQDLSGRLIDLAEQIATAGLARDSKKIDKLKVEQQNTRQERIDIESQITILNRRLDIAVAEFQVALKVERRATWDTLLPQYEAASAELVEAEKEAQQAALAIHNAGKKFSEASRKADHLKSSLQRVASEFGLEVPNLSNTSWIAIDVAGGVSIQDLLLNLVHISGKYTRKRRVFAVTNKLDSFLED